MCSGEGAEVYLRRSLMVRRLSGGRARRWLLALSEGEMEADAKEGEGNSHGEWCLTKAGEGEGPHGGLHHAEEMEGGVTGRWQKKISRGRKRRK